MISTHADQCSARYQVRFNLMHAGLPHAKCLPHLQHLSAFLSSKTDFDFGILFDMNAAQERCKACM